MSDELNKGLRGVLVAESSLSHIDGDAGKLIYRGYEIEDLAYNASYEEVLYLLWEGHLPDREELDAFTESMVSERPVGEETLEILRLLAERDETPMAALRSAVSTLSAHEPGADAASTDRTAARREGRRITAKIPTILANYDRLRRGDDAIEPREDLTHAGNFLYMLTGEEPSDIAEETMDMALILHADHGMNASTFTTIVISSTRADVYSALTGGIGALSGTLHGGANQDVIEALIDLDESEMDPVEWVKSKEEAGERVPGWGHGVYNVKDPRARILQSKLEDLSAEDGESKWLDYTTGIETYLTEEKGLPEKGIAPNVDFYSGSVYYKLGIPVDMYTPIFAMARAGGWVGQILEYTEDNKLIRPRTRYVGPKDRTFVDLKDR
ncbi:MAG: citrate synthase [Halovenus sp.]